MIRINLIPSKKKKSAAPKISAGAPGQWMVVLMLVGWGLIGGAGYWLLTVEETKTEELRAKTSATLKKIEDIRKAIDEEGLQARKDKVEQLRVAIDKLKAQQRSPVYVMHEIANILTTGKMPDVDEEEQRRLEAQDPQSRIAQNWDATSVWLKSAKESGGVISFEGSARDASDLAELVRRLRASSRFGAVSHPDYKAVRAKKGSSGSYLNWTLNAAVKRWD